MTTEGADRDRVLDWPRWMRGLGRQSLRVREFLGLSQEELARMAGVSQGAVSRLENGRGLSTPLLVVMKVSAALHTAVIRIDPATLTPEAKEIAAMRKYLPGPDGDFVQRPISDLGVEELLRVYRSVPKRHRRQLLIVLRATASALGGDDEDEDVTSTTRA
ncbi:MAG TPA: helix-turn-helix domain-containing protein [Candidatus Binatia bacterium]|jgi:transcriptional regulator with XRE-family HTH domain|nr:helix-turn-helix domain-containing protein [Candidatus Binatia bacterium]